MRLRAAAASCLAVLALSCTPPPDLPSSAHDLRILAIRTEPAEIQIPVELDPATHLPVIVAPASALEPLKLRALVVDPNGAGRAVHFVFTACPSASDLRCEGRDGAVTLAEGTLENEEASWTFSADLAPQLGALLQRAAEDDPVKGALGLWPIVTLRVTAGEEEVIGGKRIVLNPKVAGSADPNQNPPEPVMTLNGTAMAAGDVGALVRGGKMKFDVVAPDPASKENYTVLNFKGGTLSLKETFQYAWFTTLGSFGPQRTGGADFVGAEENPTGTELIPSSNAADGALSIYLVVRDGRGGETWIKRAAALSTP